MKHLFCIFALLFFCAFLGVRETKAQNCSVAVAYGTSFAWQSGNRVYGYSATELNVCAGLYYDPVTWGRFSEGNFANENTTLLGEGYTEGYANLITAKVNFSYMYPANNERYNVDTTHYVLEYYQAYRCFSSCGYYWYDYWGYGFLGGNTGGPSYYSPGYIGYWVPRRRRLGQTFHTITYQGTTSCPVGQQFTPTGKSCSVPTPTPTPVPTLTAQIKDKNDNDISNTEQVVMLGVPTTLKAQSNSSSATYQWSAPNAAINNSSGNVVQASWSSVGTYTVSLTATQGQTTKTVQATVKVQLPVFEKMDATENTPRLLRLSECANSYPELGLGCYVNSSERGITITASLKAPQGSISNDETAKIKFVQLANAYRTKITFDNNKVCYTERTSQNDTSTGWKLDSEDPFGVTNPDNPGTIDGVPLIGKFIAGKATARIADSPSASLIAEREHFISDAFETFVVYYVQPVGSTESNTIQRVMGKLAWDWQGKAVRPDAEFIFKPEFSKPSTPLTLSGVAIQGEKASVSEVRPYNGRVQDLDYEYCGPAQALDSKFVSQQIPDTVTTNAEFPVSITMKNTGTATWTAGAFVLAQPGNPSFRPISVNLPNDINPGQNATFNFNAKAPSTPNRYSMVWQMVDYNSETLDRFGESTPLKFIDVTAPSNPTGTFPGQPSDFAIWRRSSGSWWVLNGTGSSYSTFQWGMDGDLPMPGDYDGDGKTDFSVFRNSTGVWYIHRTSDSTTSSWQFGLSGDKIAQADYDGDGKTDAAIYRNGVWYILRSSDGGVTYISYGLNSDIPAPADYDGDGKADIALYRQSNRNFYVLRSSDGQSQEQVLGQTGNGIPVSGDYDGDRKADFAVKENNIWYIKQSMNGGFLLSYTWQQSTDIPVQNDYDGDGRIDIAVWRESTGYWYIRNSSDLSTRSVQWGQSGDYPVPAYYRK